MLNKIYVPKLTENFAKYDGRRKKYILLDKSDDPTEEQKLEQVFRYQLLADLQTKWEQLKLQMPGNMNWIQSTAKYYREALDLDKKQFRLKKKTLSSLDYSCQLWLDSLNEFKKELKLEVQPLSNKGFQQFRSFAIERVRKQCRSEKEVTQAWAVIAEFIDYQDKHYLLAEHYYPTLIPPKKAKLNPLVIAQNWVTEGKALVRIINAVNVHWSNTTEYSNDEILGWLLFSGIVYGGINEERLLKGWLRELISGHIHPFINERVLVSIRYEQKSYGNEREKDSDRLFNTKQVIVDLVSQCWLMRLKAQNNELNIKDLIKQISQKRIKDYVFNALSPVIRPLAIDRSTFSRLLHYASYYWEMLDDVEIDQTSVAILRGRQNNTGLVTHNFECYLDGKYKNDNNNNKPVQYDLDEILKLSISATDNSNKPKHSSKYPKAEVRKSDLVAKIKRVFKLSENYKFDYIINSLGYKQGTPYIDPSIDYRSLQSKNWKVRLTLNARIIRLCKQYDDLSENILLMWIYDLLNQKEERSHTSIIKYLSTVGYEWLYFTMGQPIDAWTQEDFEELYDDILEHKAIERGNKAINQSANMFKRMHKFAVSEFSLAPVTIEQAGKNRRVRSELVSPQAYNAIIMQLLGSIDILEREMFALLFMLVYRTGMRKKELLGLRYIDIEGLALDRPSVIVRPNSYRSTKTQGSIRRIAIFALLKPQELRFFINYVQSNVGNNLNKFIFTLSHSHQPIDDHVPLQLLRRALKDIALEKEPANFTFHAFRHTAVSNLSLVLNGREDLVKVLTDYDSDDILRIKHGLLGEHIDGSDRWYALSGTMGHLSPQRSFEYYNHVATLMATYELSFADIYLPYNMVNSITGITKKQLKENHAIVKNNNVSLKSIRKLLFKKVIKGARKSPSFVIEDVNARALDYDSSIVSNELFMRYGINRVVLFLDATDVSMPEYKAAHLANISSIDATIITERAYQVAELKTKRGQPRFVKVRHSEIPLLSPLDIQYQSDFRMLSVLQNNARKLRKNSQSDWQWFIDICSQKLTTTTASISFLKNASTDLTRFIQIAKMLLPEKSWLVTGNKSLIIEHGVDEDVKGMQMNSKKEIATVQIGIANRDARANQSKWSYSPLLRFFVHMMMITDEQLTIMQSA